MVIPEQSIIFLVSISNHKMYTIIGSIWYDKECVTFRLNHLYINERKLMKILTRISRTELKILMTSDP